MHVPTLLAAASYVAALTSAVSLHIQIPASNLIPNLNALPASTHATLTSAHGPTTLRTPLRKGNYLLFDNIPATATGSHLLEIFSHNYIFAPYRIDISAPQQQQQEPVITLAAETYRGVKWSDHGVNLVPSSGATNLTLTAKVLGQKTFYDTRQGFNILSLLKNPMILMGLFALAFTFGMPKLMENMDPEMRQEYEQMQRKSPMSAVGRAIQGGGGAQSGGGGADSFDLAGFLAGRTSGGTTSSGRSAPGGDDVRERKR
ncbi:hypothetical protein DV736_g1442, partial [Chaetothyriales sp. CBS 134916]